MTIYLQDIPLEEAQARFAQALEEAGLDGLLAVKELALDEHALGRVLAEALWVLRSSPHYHAAAMDGFALRAADTTGASPRKALSLAIGSAADYVNTGDPLPESYDAVVPIEEVEPLGEDGQAAQDPRQPAQIRLRKALVPWQHVRPMGEDMVASQLLLPAGHLLRPVDLGAIASAGHSQIRVARRPLVAILPTGSELVPIEAEPEVGQITESNSLILAAQIRAWGGEAHRFPIVPDDLNLLIERIAEAAQAHDLILVNAGSSAGSRDYVAQAVAALGEMLVHGVAVRPGHPVILGMIKTDDGKSRPVIGVPGYPVSAAITSELFVEPLLARWLGRQPESRQEVEAQLTRKVNSPPGDDDYLRVALARVGGRLLAAPLPRGAGVLSSLVRADGLALLPRGSQGAAAGDKVRVQLYRQIQEIEQTILVSGSHDISLDLIAQFLAPLGRRLVSSQLGSLGGLLSLSRGQAHLAAAHLLDPETGEYNLSYIAEYLPNTPVTLLALVGRQQGLLVKSGNPLKIDSLGDLARKDLRFVNRQRGSGTRILLDHHLALLGIDTAQINGYSREEYNHLAVAAAIASGRADCALGIPAAAQALDLAFVPLFDERYDLIVPQDVYQSELFQPLLDVLQDSSLRDAIAALPGYDVNPMGKVVAEFEG